MRTNHFKNWVAVASVTSLAFSSFAVLAQDSSATKKAVEPVAADQSVPQLSYGASQILQLAQADVGDETIIAYIKTTSNSYSLNPHQIIYLRQQGVSDTVVTTMLNQPKSGLIAETPLTVVASPDASSPDGRSAPESGAAPVTLANQDPAAIANAAPVANENAEVACVFYPDPLAPNCAGSRVTIIYYQTAPGSTCYYRPRYTPGLAGYSATYPSIGFGGRWGGGGQGGWRGDSPSGSRRDGFHPSGSIHGGRYR